METRNFWCVWDPAEEDEHLFEDLADALDLVKALCEGGLEREDMVRIENRRIVFQPREK